MAIETGSIQTDEVVAGYRLSEVNWIFQKIGIRYLIIYTPRGGPQADPVETGPVAQGIRAHGYEPRRRGFESLLARENEKSRMRPVL